MVNTKQQLCQYLTEKSFSNWLNQKVISQSDSPLVVANNVKKFMRYHIPPEVKITHGLRMSNGGGGGRHAGETQIASMLSNGGPRNMKSEEEEEMN